MQTTIERHQRGIGQGGFHTCSMVAQLNSHHRELPFEFVFDCGTSSRGPGLEEIEPFLKRHIEAYKPNAGVVDLLFLSHLDQDHYNGAKALCKAKSVSRIVMPYFTVEEFTLAVLFQSGAIDEAGASFIEKMFAIARKLTDKLFDVDLTIVGGPGQPSRDLPSTAQGRLVPVCIQADGSETAIGSMLPSGANVGLRSGEERLKWILRPWSYKRSTAAQRAMKAAIRAIPELVDLCDGNQPIRQTVIEAIRARKSEIRTECQKIIATAGGANASNNNLPSLCLYSGPPPGVRGQFKARYIERGVANKGLKRDPVGWITTGDCEMRQCWPDFSSTYADVLKNTGTYVVPHHGSSDNNHPDFIRSVSGRLAVIAARSKALHHPGLSTLDTIHEADDVIFQVDEYCRYGLLESVLLRQ